MSMISGAHVVVFSRDSAADAAFFRDVLKLPNVDAGRGWLIFALPPTELAVHPDDAPGASQAGAAGDAAGTAGAAEGSGGGDRTGLYLICDDLEATMASLRDQGRSCEPVVHQRWGSVTQVHLPSGGRVGLYQPNHPRP